MTRPRLLDLFCGAGGAAVGYHRAGFDVVGVDHVSQPHYPFSFIKGDAPFVLGCLRRGDSVNGYELSDFAAIHASPPCQRYSKTAARWGSRESHPDLLGEVRHGLTATGRPWVIENVSGAPLGFAGMLCGTMFGLKVFRHRWFEASFCLLTPSHPRHNGSTDARSDRPGKGWRGGRNGYVTVAGRTCCPVLARAAMGIDWTSGAELAQAIPPAYTEFLGRQLRDHVAAA